VHVPTGAWLLIGIGTALVLVTVLLVFIIPSGQSRRRRLNPGGLRAPRFKIPFASPAGSMVKGFSYLYAPLRYQPIHSSVGGRLERAIARVDAVDPSVTQVHMGQALHQMVELVSGPTEPPTSEGEEPVVDIFDQPRNEEPT
jgi:hypothetical protein